MVKRLLFIVSGEDAWVVPTEGMTLADAREQVLKKTRNTGRPPEEWEIRAERGIPLAGSQLVSTFEDHTVRLFLSLKVGAGGSVGLYFDELEERRIAAWVLLDPTPLEVNQEVIVLKCEIEISCRDGLQPWFDVRALDKKVLQYHASRIQRWVTIQVERGMSVLEWDHNF